MTVKLNRMMIISLIVMLLCAGIFLPVRQFVPEEYVPGGVVTSTLISSDFRDFLPEMVTQEKGINIISYIKHLPVTGQMA